MPTLPEGSIVAEHVWKRYRADRGKPKLHDQMVKLGRRIQGERQQWRWVLKDVSLEVKPGGSLALIGVNGSGKTTMLKVISKVTYQTAGHCQSQGRIGALLEVRSGVNPLLTGRENIYLYGSILGLTRRQISERFDTIVEFAELADAVDRQVKYFSSGMQVRLGFAIAAHLDPDILLVDEVLAVGDATFQQKCLQRISEVVADGTTLLFVSHDLAAVEAMCDRAIWLVDGSTRAAGATRDVLAQYRSAIEENAAVAMSPEGSVQVLDVEVTAPDDGPLTSGGEANARMVLNAPEAGEAHFFIGVSEGTAMPIFVVRHSTTFPKGEFELHCSLKDLPLPKGRYYLWLAMLAPSWLRTQPHLSWRPVRSFDISGPNPEKAPRGVMVLSPVWVDAAWKLS